MNKEIFEDMALLLEIILNDYTGEEKSFQYLENKYHVKLESDKDTDKLLEKLDSMLMEV